MKMNNETCLLWLRRTAGLWESGDLAGAKLSGNMTRWQLEQLSMETIQHALHICGARSLMKPGALERIYRNLSFYSRHDNDDVLLSSIGKSTLGIGTDLSFYTRKSTSVAARTNESEPHE
jgi:alkylation response protein AidB-like acyl-CoA dehydrogenase